MKDKPTLYDCFVQASLLILFWEPGQFRVFQVGQIYVGTG